MIKVIPVTSEYSKEIYNIKQKSFMPLLEIYHDYCINPIMQDEDYIKKKMSKKNIMSYIFSLDNKNVGFVSINELDKKVYKISDLCVIPEYQNKGIAQEALKIIENNYPGANQWILFTIAQEKRNCHLYEKLGYTYDGITKIVHENMTLIKYVKQKHLLKTYNKELV